MLGKAHAFLFKLFSSSLRVCSKIELGLHLRSKVRPGAGIVAGSVSSDRQVQYKELFGVGALSILDLRNKVPFYLGHTTSR